MPITVVMADRCFCIFEGGGAKGIAHVGALAALEESGLELCGFAGTSAGAVIAALAAVGYRSSDLVSEAGTILDRIDLDQSNIWGGEPAWPAGRPSRLFGRFGWTLIVLARNRGGLLLLGLAALIVMAPALLVTLGVLAPGWAIPAVAASLVVLFLLASLVASGLASLATFERCLNQLLRLRLASRLDRATAHQARSPEPVTFRDLERAGCPPLRVVAADISTRELKLFSYATTPREGVASAVAASVCLPVVFRPWRILRSLHLDGGLVSNLPAWAFDAERALDRDAWTAVVQVGAPTSPERLWGLGIIKGAVLTGIFGSALLNVRNVDRLKAVRLKVGLDLLQFDPGLKVALAVVEEAKSTSVERLVYHLRDVPDLMDDICGRIQLRAEQVLSLVLRTQRRPDFAGRLRASIFVHPREDPSSLTADFQAGFTDAPDERLRLPVQGSIVGQALEDGEPLFLERDDPSWSTYISRPQDRWIRKAVSPDLRWVLCVPYVKEANGIRLVVAVDSNADLDLEPDLVDVAMGSISDGIVTMLDAFVPKEAFVDGSS
jgi:NTE family protein